VYIKHIQQSLNTWALFVCLAVLALFATPFLLGGQFAALTVVAICVFSFGAVLVLSLFIASRGNLTTFSLLKKVGDR
jgi:hypothetical protein